MLSDTEFAAELLQTAGEVLRKHLSVHYLLVGQNSLPALAYLRRHIAQALANDCAVVFCNPFMAAVDVFRRAVSTAISINASYNQDHSPIRINTLAQAQQRLLLDGRSEMPLAQVANVVFPTMP